MDFMKGYKTWVGLAMTIMGMLSSQFGWTWWDATAESTRLAIEQGFMTVGSMLAVYGNYMSHRREKQN